MNGGWLGVVVVVVGGGGGVCVCFFLKSNRTCFFLTHLYTYTLPHLHVGHVGLAAHQHQVAPVRQRADLRLHLVLLYLWGWFAVMELDGGCVREGLRLHLGFIIFWFLVWFAVGVGLVKGCEEVFFLV